MDYKLFSYSVPSYDFLEKKMSCAYVFYFRYHALILEALSTLNDPNGTDVCAIHRFIEVSALCVENCLFVKMWIILFGLFFIRGLWFL